MRLSCHKYLLLLAILCSAHFSSLSHILGAMASPCGQSATADGVVPLTVRWHQPRPISYCANIRRYSTEPIYLHFWQLR
uniref:Secreted protein n=1 Tax=Anguilla anguilla TaxID=7936 RepID=A0A0E9W8L9_ANGAN